MNELVDPSGSYLVVKNSSSTEFVAANLTIEESLSENYEWVVDVLVTKSAPSDWIGEEVSCDVFSVVGSSRSSARQFKGYVVKAQAQSQRIDSTYYTIRLTVTPWLFLLKHSRQCRVFQEQTTQTIVTSIFDDLGFKGNYSVKSMPSTKHEYCVQFNESDFDFITRLLAEEGVHFFFGKDSKADTLYLQDASKPFAKDDLATLDYAAAPTGDYDVLNKWQREHAFHSASVELTAYDYNQTKLVTSKAKKSKYSVSGNTKLTELFYPTSSKTGAYTDLASSIADVQRGQLDSGYHKVLAETESADLCVGHYLKLNAHPSSSEKGNYLVSKIHCEIKENGVSGVQVNSSLICIPEDQQSYPAMREKPVVHGLQSAVVAGSKDGEPANDASGRVRIKFHWDPETGDKTSCWVRVAQGMAGSSYGMQFLPRAGQEVLVSFINGDPNQPVVVSSVYNNTKKPPYPTANTTQSGVKTKLVGESNELRFDDKKDNESIYMHAAKDLTSDVVNDHTETVGGEMSLAVTKNIKQTVEKTHSLTAKEDVSVKTEKNYTLTATEKITEKGKEITLEGDSKITLKVGSSEIVMTSSKIEISSGTVEISGSSKVSVDGGSLSQSGTSVSIKSDGSFSAKGGTSMSLQAGTSLSAKGSTGVTIKGLNCTMQGDVGATVKGNATAEISASGMTTVKGGVVMVN
ncbi:type VI secretion system tip protein VgrG [Marinomonas mediterranea]|uniref:Type VI secretion system Vgr family protein n=1 Tax=Marinomonas mediterranea (strain ATCC 700492 / JCM 21426 / NBRC 103028 / MMB-1) TaxID=717774 RepID=F2K2K5_MARM1|nr:type VI secretion system tip protein TssI/VgrG [Marinomonas mediterranea]ADZ90050.1 type VI secretion system Vgr family protein [Marinomonas mediterranea MMB-1]WCN12185.1 type VI secretion system tip protein VgrG [Marinomonas mediterranea]WCN16257.1 type VI secretion system tip protein VgrG [Marinomonas mediterranea MMB-1]